MTTCLLVKESGNNDLQYTNISKVINIAKE